MRASLLAIGLLAAACGSSRKDAGGGSLGQATAAAVLAAVDAAADAVEPWRCARVDAPAAARLTVATQAAPRIAFVSQARVSGDGSPPVLAAVRAALDAAPVDVVVALGGMGQTESEILAALNPLAENAPWLLVAIPGDRESMPDHRAAVNILAGAGARVVDGSQVRLLDLGKALIATLPGAPAAGRLAAGSDGCVHDDDDVTLALRDLAAAAAPARKGGKRRPTLLASPRAPRGRSDLAPGGIHAGDVALAHLLAADPVELVVHGAVDDASSPAGVARRDRVLAGKPPSWLGVAVGAVDLTPRYRASGARVLPSLLVVTVGERELAWKPVVPAVVP